MKRKWACLLLLLALYCNQTTAQQQLTKEQILSMSTEELSELPLEDLMAAVETLGVSSVDELFALIMNKNVSSASKEEEDNFTSPLATTVITRDELRTYGATTLEDAFRLIPGVIVSQKYNGVYDIHIRGLNNLPDNNLLLYTENNNTLLMVDGRIVQNYITGAVMLDKLPISVEDVNRIEVVRGACSALYGMNAVTGIINIITEKPSSESKEVSGSIQMGNLNTYVGDIALRKKISDKISAGISFNIQYRERPTGDINVAPQFGLMHANSSNVYNACTNFTPNQSAEERQNILQNNATKVSPEGGLYPADYIENMFIELNGNTYQILEEYADINKRFEKPLLSRKNYGLNGYLSFTLTPDATIDLTGGYQNSYILSYPLTYSSITMAGQESKTGYVNIAANIKKLHILANYSGGPQNLYVGFPCCKVFGHNFNAQAEYEIEVGKLNIHPAIAYQYLYYKDHDNEYNGQKMSALFNDHADLSTISPSLRLDYRTSNQWRFIAAVRGDKTSAPDKWNVSWQGEIAKKITDNNFVRVVYGKSYRAPNMINTATSLEYDRNGLYHPNGIDIMGSTDAELMSIDNFEIGYRFKPTQFLLIDAEVFYSHSHNYGALMPKSSTYAITSNAFLNGMSGGLTMFQPDTDPQTTIRYLTEGIINNYMTTRSTMVYRNLPYEANQIGLSCNIDWIISPKLIVKVNANVQKTTIDDYYEYSINTTIDSQITNAHINTANAINELIGGIVQAPDITLPDGSKVNSYTAAAFQKANADIFQKTYNYDSWDNETKQGFLELLKNNFTLGQQTITYNGQDYIVENALALYYGLKHNVRLDVQKDSYEIGRSDWEEPEHIDNYKHKATPAAYGMIGVVYKPISQLTIAAFGNYMHHRTYNTCFSDMMNSNAMRMAQDSDQRQLYTQIADDSKVLHSKFTLNMKVGYKPNNNAEIFANAQNLFNTNTQEAIYSDKIGGLYTIGINFSF